MTRSRVPELPTTSVAEFREAAWPVKDRNMVGRVVMQIYLTWAALAAAAGLFAVAVFGLVAGQDGSLVIAVVAGLLTALLLWRVVRKLGRAREAREHVDSLSREVDGRAARGEIPVTPAGWDGRMPPAPHERSSSWL